MKKQIIKQLKQGKIITSKQIEKMLNCNNVSARLFMHQIEDELYKQGILLCSCKKGYYIPKNEIEAKEGMEFLYKKAMAILKRNKQRLKLYKKNFNLNYSLDFKSVK